VPLQGARVAELKLCCGYQCAAILLALQRHFNMTGYTDESCSTMEGKLQFQRDASIHPSPRSSTPNPEAAKQMLDAAKEAVEQGCLSMWQRNKTEMLPLDKFVSAILLKVRLLTFTELEGKHICNNVAGMARYA